MWKEQYKSAEGGKTRNVIRELVTQLYVLSKKCFRASIGREMFLKKIQTPTYL